jgi:integrase
LKTLDLHPIEDAYRNFLPSCCRNPKNLAPHDLRRTCAKLCRKSGGDLEQIQMLLGHASIQTTEKYLGMQQNLVEAVNDKLGIFDAESQGLYAEMKEV